MIKLQSANWLSILLLPVFFVFITCDLFAQERVEPPFWWVGMDNEELQILIKDENIGAQRIRLNHPSISLVQAHTFKNKNYQFLDIRIPKSAQSTILNFEVLDGEGKLLKTIPYELKERTRPEGDFEGFNSSDVVYLITPDRFCNGDLSNDEDVTMKEGINKEDPYGRHGGDIQGIIDHLDYIDQMGFTAIWINPLLENNMPKQSYHGYATTDYYKIDPRFGTNELYVELVEKARERGIKVIMDQIANHSGSEHWWMKDMPMEDWVNFPDSIEICNHRKTTVLDPYASKFDRKYMTDGWFVPQMPDLNQQNSFMSKYLIQNSIWWIEYAGLGGIRQDTYSYPDKGFLTDWSCAIMEEYDNFNIVGEEWTYNPVVVSYWQAGSNNMDAYNSCLPSVMDFPLQNSMSKALTEKPTWSTGIKRLYEALANDVLYPDPNNLMIFGDNHDMSRIFTQMNEDVDLWKMALTYISTMRGIPQIYYGTEVLMSNKGTESHGVIRSDMQGGWPGDSTNVFTGLGMASEVKEAQTWLKNLLNWRKDKTCIHSGDILHFEPVDEAYVYFRYTDDKMVMVVLNRNEKPVQLAIDRFQEILRPGASYREVLSGQEGKFDKSFSFEAKRSYIFEIYI